MALPGSNHADAAQQEAGADGGDVKGGAERKVEGQVRALSAHARRVDGKVTQRRSPPSVGRWL
eukprot:3522142-Rhodomonas_salina.1